jgi:AcrR family transcriptional regulator
MPTIQRPEEARAAGAARRLSWEARYEQLTTAAMPMVAEHGFADFSLDEITERAGVTRKLLYHYFPRGRPDVVLAVAERAGHELTDDWVVDDTIPLSDRLALNIGRIVQHAMGPSDAWRIYRLARTSAHRELSETVDRFVDVVVSSIALNQLGTDQPPPLPLMAIRGFLAYFESVLDDARTTGTALEPVARMLNETLPLAIQAALNASG